MRWVPRIRAIAVVLGVTIGLVPFLVGCGGQRGAGGEERVYSHTVKPGETFYKIADQYYGDPSRARSLMAFNHVNEAAVPPGTVVRVPMSGKDVANLKTREVARQPYNAGLKLAEDGAYLDATQEFQRALEIDPRFVDARYNLGVTLQQMKSYEKALGQFRKVASERPNDPKYQFALGNCYFYLERYSNAAEAFENVIELDRSHLKAQYSLAVCYEKMGKTAEARQAWRRYLEIDDTSAWADEARKHLKNLE